MATRKRISIVVPVKNGIDTLERFIKGIKLQSLFDETEIVIIDSGSEDGSIEYLSKFSFVTVVQIDPKTFNHGNTRNLAVSHCEGDFILMTVQDAWTTDSKLLERMVGHFEDKDVMGVCGHQVVPQIEGFNPHQWFRPQNTAVPKFLQFKKGEFNKLSPEQQFRSCGWDNVISMYRTSGLTEIPFAKTDFAEDLLWSKQALMHGYKIVYDHRNMVNHYHHSYSNYVYKRIFIELYSVFTYFNYKRDLKVTSKTYFKVVVRNVKWGLSPYWIVFNFRALRARDKANTLFHKSLNKSKDELDRVYLEVCGEIPQGTLSKNKK